jgi:hypothetical protein
MEHAGRAVKVQGKPSFEKQVSGKALAAGV